MYETNPAVSRRFLNLLRWICPKKLEENNWHHGDIYRRYNFPHKFYMPADLAKRQAIKNDGSVLDE
jgi:hypothetical protein